MLRNVNRDKTKKAIFLEKNTLYKYERFERELIKMIAVFQAEINRYQKEYNLKAYEASINTQNLEKVTSKLTDLESTYGKKNLKNNDAYKDLVAYQIAYDAKKDSLDTEMAFLKNTLESFKSARTNDVKRESSFWCFG